jgi:Protein of unknown function, DUF255
MAIPGWSVRQMLLKSRSRYRHKQQIEVARRVLAGAGGQMPKHNRPLFFVVVAMLLCAAHQLPIMSCPVAFGQSASAEKITSFPSAIDKACRKGRARLYDECSDQRVILASAAKQAEAEGKVLLVSYGAEWCIWCHVLAKHLYGETTRFTYTFGYPTQPEARDTATIYERAGRDTSGDAKALRSFVAQSFVLVHIEGHYARGGMSVLQATGAEPLLGQGIPLVFTVNRAGRYAGHLEHQRVEVRRDTEDWYRGYDRSRLLAELRKLRDAAVK